MDIDLFAGVAVSDLPRAVIWFDRFFGDVETFEPNDTERVWTVVGAPPRLRRAAARARRDTPW